METRGRGKSRGQTSSGPQRSKTHKSPKSPLKPSQPAPQKSPRRPAIEQTAPPRRLQTVTLAAKEKRESVGPPAPGRGRGARGPIVDVEKSARRPVIEQTPPPRRPPALTPVTKAKRETVTPTRGRGGRGPLAIRFADMEARPRGRASVEPKPKSHVKGKGERPKREEPTTPLQFRDATVAKAFGDFVTQLFGITDHKYVRIVNENRILYTKPMGMTIKRGSSGYEIALYGNYLPLVQKEKWFLYRYRVNIAPKVDQMGRRKALMKDAAQGYFFDGEILYTPQKIYKETTELMVMDNNDNFKITLKFIGNLPSGDVHYVQVFGLIMRKCLLLMGLTKIGRNHYQPDEKMILPELKIQLWSGYYASINQHEKDLLLNVDLQLKVMSSDNIYNLMASQARKDFLIGRSVFTPYNQKIHKIDDIDYETTPDHLFKMADGSEISYREYYRSKYNMEVRFGDQPMLVSRSNPREVKSGMPEIVYLVPEFCQLTGLTDSQRDDLNLMTVLRTHTLISVDSTVKKYVEFSKKIRAIEEMRKWNLNLGEGLVKLKGRVLPEQAILCGNNWKYAPGKQASWTRESHNRSMFHSVKVEFLAVVCPFRFKDDAKDFLQAVTRAARALQWSIGSTRIFDISDDRIVSYIDQIDRVVYWIKPTLILCILPNSSRDRYTAIKKKCCADKGVPVQLILHKNLKSKQIAAKVAVQMNCKIGGAPWSVTIPLNNLMVVGHDVCAHRRVSFSGMVASLDKYITRYYSVTAEYKFEEELSNNFAGFMVTACQKYKSVNRVYPERIVIYRAGVADGQLPYVYSNEVENVKSKLIQEIYKQVELRLAFVVVSKRNNTKFFTEKENPPPGTVVDDVITLPERYDFYLVSHFVRQGIATPTNYNVLSDSTGLSPDKMQMLTYKLTHLYYNWSGTIKVPAPCQYARKLAFMTAQYLHKSAHPNLQDVLFYL